ncbi:MAG: histidine kinase [Gemmatimonadaceae bacterium]|nr:histidine kinase [Gemmatimonadaceae bacterium]
MFDNSPQKISYDASAGGAVTQTPSDAPVLRHGWLLLTAIACGLGGITPLTQALDTVGTPDPFRYAAIAQLCAAASWYAASGVLARRWSLADNAPRALVDIGLIVVSATLVATVLITRIVPIPATYSIGTQRVEIYFGWLPTHALTVGMLSLVSVWTSARARRERELHRTALLNASLVQAQLETLRTRVAPHFLLNTLNTVVALARTGQADRAADVAADLGALMHFALSESGDAVAFDTECEIVERYLAIEKARFGDRLQIQWTRDAESRSCRVPALMWQPLVENAIRHGLARRSAPGVLHLKAQCQGAGDERELLLVVDADGPDMPEDTLAESLSPEERSLRAMPLGGLGLGTATVEQRLRLLYGITASLVVTMRPDGGSRTELRLPAPLLEEVT